MSRLHKKVTFLYLYAIHFNGIYPVGAVAVVRAKNEEEAYDSFKFKLTQTYPSLVKDNSRTSVRIDKLANTRDMCTILLNGEY